MRMLSAQDASFIYLESDHCPMHIGGVYLLDSRLAPPGFGYERFRAHIESRLPASAIFRQRLVEATLSLSHPCWINDPDFHLDRHLPRLRVAAPGGEGELMRLAAHVFGECLDRNRPLWELAFVEGVDQFRGMGKGSFAIITRVHHAAVDGGSGIELMGALLDLTPEPRILEKPDDWQPEPLPGTGRMVRSAYSRVGRKSVELGKLLGQVASGAAHAYSKRKIKRISPPTLPFSAPASILNRAVSSSRTYAAIDFDFARIRGVRKAYAALGTGPEPAEATVNDVVLAVCAGGLRAYLQERGALPSEPLVAMAPVSVRDASQKGSMGNQVSAMLVALATDIADPLQQLIRISHGTHASKIYSSAVPANKIAEFIPSETLAAATRLYTRMRLGGRHRPFFNLAITNVPGPAVPLYLGGAQLSSMYGMAPILDGMGLIIVVLSYAGRISLGLTSCFKVIPDPAHLGVCMEQALVNLENAVLSAVDLRQELAAAPAKTKPATRPRVPVTAGKSLQNLRAASRALDDAIAALKERTGK